MLTIGTAAVKTMNSMPVLIKQGRCLCVGSITFKLDMSQIDVEAVPRRLFQTGRQKEKK